MGHYGSPMGPYTPTEPQRKVFNLLLIFFLTVLTKLHLGFSKFKCFFIFSVNMEPNGDENSKPYSSYISQSKVFKFHLNFSLNGAHKTAVGSFWNIEFLIFNDCFSNSFWKKKMQIHHCTLWRNQKPPLSGKRAIVEWHTVKFRTCR